ncbi:MAG: SAM-dependent methyltransferase [Sneathiella sp.]|nr:MAG: SAM-dependent methyltransferase [Sneathiella sp.]
MFLLSQMLKRLIKTGTLTVIDYNGREYVFSGAPGRTSTMRFHDKKTARKLAFYPKLRLGELFMEGEMTVEEGDIYDLLTLFVTNFDWRSHHPFSAFSDLVQKIVWYLTKYNPRSRSLNNVAHHYDLSDELYELFLDSNRQYSCAYFERPNDSLEQAQLQKMSHITAKLALEPGQKVLDIGCGWGGLAQFIAENTNSHVSGITLSTNQLTYARERARQAGLDGNVDYSLTDYRDVSETYDRIVSVGMFEHVGAPHYKAFFDKIRTTLAEDGIALIHTIGAANTPSPINPWIQKYIFPGSYIPSLSQVAAAIEKAGLYIDDIEILRVHYAETLRIWRENFNANREKATEIYDERFCRMWEFYLTSVEAAFRVGSLVVFQIQISKQMDGAPITRDYIGDTRRQLQSQQRQAAE